MEIWMPVQHYTETDMVVFDVWKGVVAMENLDHKPWGGNRNHAQANMLRRTKIVCYCIASVQAFIDLNYDRTTFDVPLAINMAVVQKTWRKQWFWIYVNYYLIFIYLFVYVLCHDVTECNLMNKKLNFSVKRVFFISTIISIILRTHVLSPLINIKMIIILPSLAISKFSLSSFFLLPINSVIKTFKNAFKKNFTKGVSC